MAVSASLHLLAIYVPKMQLIFDTVPLSLRDWYIIIGLALTTVVLIDLRKIVWPVSDGWRPLAGSAIRVDDAVSPPMKKWEEGLAAE